MDLTYNINKKHIISNTPIYCYKISSNDIDQNSLSLLTDIEQKQAQKYCFIKDRNNYIIRHLILKEILSANYNNKLSLVKNSPNPITDFYYDPLGKPHSKNTNIQFSISKTKNYFIIATSHKNTVGIDIEDVINIPNYQDSFNLFLTPEEISEIKQYSTSEQLKLFYLFWTAKEAFVKAIGTGLNENLKNIQFSIINTQHHNNLPFHLYINKLNLTHITKSQISLQQFQLDNNYISLINIAC